MGKGKDGAKVAQVACCGFIIVFILLLVIILPNALEKVGSTEVGLPYNSVWGILGDQESLMTEGLKQKPVFGAIIKWPTDYQIVEFKGTPSSSGTSATRVARGIACNSKDGIQISLQASFQFVPKQAAIYKLTMDYTDFKTYEKLVKIQARSAIRHGCGNFTAQDFQTRRAEVQTVMESKVKEYCEKVYQATVKLLQLKNIERPAQYQSAVEGKESARSDIILAENERQQKLTVSYTALDKSYQLANATLDSAYTDGNITLAFAKADATAVTERYIAYSDSYGDAMDTHSLTPAGVLSYFGSQMVGGKAGPDQTMNLPATAKVSYVSEL